MVSCSAVVLLLLLLLPLGPSTAPASAQPDAIRPWHQRHQVVLRNSTPTLWVPRLTRVIVGSSTLVRVIGIDLDRDRLSITAESLPDGVAAASSSKSTATFSVTPTDAGVVRFDVTVEDEHGASSSRTVEVFARYTSRPDALIGMGDSVASGFGLDRSDYLNRDPCWRDEKEAYPAKVFAGLRAIGLLGANAQFALVACEGFKTADVLVTPVTGGITGTAPAGVAKLAQTEWVVRSNPGYVTLTIGANDIHFGSPDRFINDGVFDNEALAQLLDTYRTDLAAVLRRLVEGTDSKIFLTTYYDPSGEIPEGVEGCRGACFSDVLDAAVSDLNTSLRTVVDDIDNDRVVVVDLREAFDGHGAPNGLGPDGLRSGGWGVIGDFVGRFTAGVHAFCSQGYTNHDTWVNSLDCVHPDADGVAQIAELVVSAASEGQSEIPKR